jgi:FkbM family methyltransferase
VSALLRIVRRLATAPLFRRLTSVTPLLRLSYALRASLVRERARFARNELRPGPATAVYRLRESGVAVAIRHHTGDVMVLDEIFSQREYELPKPVRTALSEVPGPLEVLDLGANIGLFGAWLLGRFPDARIVAFEPDPGNAAVHRQTIAANEDAEGWRLIEAFAAAAPGSVPFVSGSHATSRQSHGENAIAVEAVDVFGYMEGIDLLKIDIEGAEWPLLADPRFRQTPARAIVVEYHSDNCPHPDAASAAAEALEAAGYETLPGTTKPVYGAGVLWGVRLSAQRRP